MMDIMVTVCTGSEAEAALKTECGSIFLDSSAYEAENYQDIADKIRKAKKRAGLILPRIFRDKASAYFEKHVQNIKNASFDAFLIPSLEGLRFLETHEINGVYIADKSLYAFNSSSAAVLKRFGFDTLTVPEELNYKEIRAMGPAGMILSVYGRESMMISANCIQNTTSGCDGKRHVLTLTDRMGNRLPTVNCCRYCMNTIYNALPLSLLDAADTIEGFSLSAVRLDFTIESGKDVRKITDLFYRTFVLKEKTEENLPEFTRGHFKRGVQ